MYQSSQYTHASDRAALKALKAIPGFHQFVKAFMNVWSERQFRIMNMSSNLRISEKQLPEYYNMLPPICEKLGIDIPDLYLELNVNPNSYTAGDTKPFIVITSGLFETIPMELIPTVLAHECGHIACHHVLYTTMGRIILNGTSSAMQRLFSLYGSIAMLPLQVAFFYWMRCSELSADRAAALCDGSSEKMTDVCMRLAGYDKDIDAKANKEEFMGQAVEYREMINKSKWDKTLEFFALQGQDHPFVAVRALECKEWGESDRFMSILKGMPVQIEEDVALDGKKMEEEAPEEKSKKARFRVDLPKFMKKENDKDKEARHSAVVDELREYKQLLDDGIITEEEFQVKKKQLLGI